MNNAMQRYLEAASGIGNLTKSSAEKIVKQLVRQGEAATENASEMVDDLLERQRKNRDAIASIVKAETNRVVKSLGLASVKEVERLQKQVADLKRSLAEAEKVAKAADRKADKATGTKTAKKATKKKPAKKSTRKKATKKAAKKSSGS